MARVDGETLTSNSLGPEYEAYLEASGNSGAIFDWEDYLNWRIDCLLIEKEIERRNLDRDFLFNHLAVESRREAAERILVDRELKDMIAVSENEVVRYYEENKSDYAHPKTVRIRQIMTDTREAAEGAWERINAGEDFANVAREVSIHPNKADGGALPPFVRGTYNPEFEAKVFELGVSELSGVFQTDLGYHVAEKTAETPVRATPLDQVREEIKVRLAQQKRQAAIESLCRRLRRQAEIDFFVLDPDEMTLKPVKQGR